MGQLLFTFLKIDCATNVMTMLMSKLYRAEVILQINTLSAAQRSILIVLVFIPPLPDGSQTNFKSVRTLHVWKNKHEVALKIDSDKQCTDWSTLYFCPHNVVWRKILYDEGHCARSSLLLLQSWLISWSNQSKISVVIRCVSYHVHVHLCFLLLFPVCMEEINRGDAFKGLEQ